MIKKILTLALTITSCFVVVVAKADKKTVTQWGGKTHTAGADTYKLVQENDKHNKLNCEQPGDVICCWSSGDDPLIVVSGSPLLMSAAYNYVLSMVAQNVFTGSVMDDNGINGYSWIATSSSDLEFTFDGR